MENLFLKLQNLSQELAIDSSLCRSQMDDGAGPEWRDRWLENGGAMNVVDVLIELLKGHEKPFDKFLAEIREFISENTETKQEAA